MLKRTVLLRGFFWVPTTYVLVDKQNKKNNNTLFYLEAGFNMKFTLLTCCQLFLIIHKMHLRLAPLLLFGMTHLKDSWD